MIRTIQQRIYVVGLLPLALLAVALVILNGWERINEAHRELERFRAVTAALLHGPAVDALVIGNSLNFEDSANDVIRTSRTVVCVALRDKSRRIVAEVGRCEGGLPQLNYVSVVAPGQGLSDFSEHKDSGPIIGELGVLLSDETVVHKRRQVIGQLVLSVCMIASALVLTARQLRARLVERIHRIGRALHALSQRDYNTHVVVDGRDELTQLAQGINDTIRTIAAYTRELERRRYEADQALHDADAANLTRDGLVRSLTEDVAEPMAATHSALTAIAIANTDPALRGGIKSVLALLQEAQSNFEDLVEIATSVERTRPVPWLELADIWSDTRRDIHRLSEADGIPVNFVVTPMDSFGGEPAGISLNLDGRRLKKAIVCLVRALARRSRGPGIQVNVELIKRSADQVHASVHLTAFYERQMPLSSRSEGSIQSVLPSMAVLGLTDREAKVVDYLLRAVGVTFAANISSGGTASVLLTVTCPYAMTQTDHGADSDWIGDVRPIAAALVSDDVSLRRFTTRGEMSNHEFTFITARQVLDDSLRLHGYDVLLIDVSDDFGEAISLLEALKADGSCLPQLIAICPPGRVSDVLANRLFELGFTGMVQKPVQYSRLVEVIRTTLAHTLKIPESHVRKDHSGDRH